MLSSKSATKLTARQKAILAFHGERGSIKDLTDLERTMQGYPLLTDELRKKYGLPSTDLEMVMLGETPKTSSK